MKFDLRRRTGFMSARWTPSVLAAWPLWMVMAVCVGLAFGGSGTRRILRYDRTAVAAGQWWRLFTGNFVHFGWIHVGLDLAGISLLWLLVGSRLAGWRWIAATIAGAWAVGLGLWWAWPQVAWYVGISGVAHTYWAAGALLLALTGAWEGWVLLFMLAAKLAWEQATGAGLPSSAALLHEPVLTSAHLVGAIAGIVAGVGLAGLEALVRRRERRSAHL